MAKIEYDVVCAKSLVQLIEQVNTRLLFGWKPQGGISVALEDGAWYAQAIVRG